MDRDELGGLSREELLELVRRQQEELAARAAAIERPGSRQSRPGRRRAVERVMGTSADIQETTRRIRRHVELVAISETDGYSTIDKRATIVANRAA